MKHRIIISELDEEHIDQNIGNPGSEPANPRPVYEQVIDGINLHSLITAINALPRTRIRNRTKKNEAAQRAD